MQRISRSPLISDVTRAVTVVLPVIRLVTGSCIPGRREATADEDRQVVALFAVDFLAFCVCVCVCVAACALRFSLPLLESKQTRPWIWNSLLVCHPRNRCQGPYSSLFLFV